MDLFWVHWWVHNRYGFCLGWDWLIPSLSRMCPIYCISLAKKWHLLSFIDSFASQSFSKTALMCSKHSLGVELYMMMSSK